MPKRGKKSDRRDHRKKGKKKKGKKGQVVVLARVLNDIDMSDDRHKARFRSWMGDNPFLRWG